ncbi:MAG: monoamine oxidase [Pedosphaera sp.]|nr:monoamine oxidase [Pedosphaera sp.]
MNRWFTRRRRAWADDASPAEDFFNEGQVVERGGEFIDTGHRAVRHLARELGLKLDDLLAAEPSGTEPFYYFNGQPYSYAQASADFAQIFDTLQKDLLAANYPTRFDHFTTRGQQLDQLSIAQYIDEIVPGCRASPLGQLLDVAYKIEFGAETSEQSALNLLYLLGYSSQQPLGIYGESDERFRIHGGNDQLVSSMADALAGQIETGAELQAVVKRSDGRHVLSFGTGASTSNVAVDHVVFALPFSILRDSIDYSHAGFSPLKEIAIEQLGMGTNSKFQLQFNRRLWNTLGNNGDTYSDTGYQNTWESTRAQGGRSGVLVNFSGGANGLTYNKPVPQLASRVLSQLEPALPGISAKYNGLATVDYWPSYRWTRGSYAFWKVGQYTEFARIEGMREGNAHFCREHTSIDFQGYLNGAVDTGERVAKEIIRSRR